MVARRHVEHARLANEEFRESGEPAARRRALAPRLITVHRTDADLRNVDLTLDLNERSYGSQSMARPSLISRLRSASR